jgi:hypothetical protein
VAAREGKATGHVFVDGGHGPPDEPSRVVLKRFLERLDARCAGVVMCLAGDGFVAATSNVDGASWLLEQLGPHARRARPA